MGVKGRKVIPEQKPKKEQSMHSKLVDVAYRWVLKNASCGVAFKEFNSGACNGEYPDVIGFGSGGHSILIEVKTSRSDFLSDRKKSFRINPELGMGKWRFYCCPTDLVKQSELPTNWGLIYVDNKNKVRCVYNPMKDFGDWVPPQRDGNKYGYYTKDCSFKKNDTAEHGLMYSALRRLFLRGRIDEIYEQLAVKREESRQANEIHDELNNLFYDKDKI